MMTRLLMTKCSLSLSVDGSSLFESDMAHFNMLALTEGACSSVHSSVPMIASVSVPAMLFNHCEPGFVDKTQSGDVLKRINAANIGINSRDEITMKHVIIFLLKTD
jgi:hypothetical protein